MSTPETKPIKVGFVGLSANGWASLSLAPALLDPAVRAHYKLTAVSTTNPTSAAASAEKYSQIIQDSVKAYSGDVSQIAADPSVDFVAVAAKAPCHKEAVTKVIEQGKPFFVEWPAGRNLEETLELARLAKEKGVRSLVGLEGRQSNLFRKIKNLIESGKVGKLLAVTVNILAPIELQAWAPITKESAIYTLDKDNGITLVSTGAGHFLDTLVQTVGPFSRVSARGTTLFPNVTILDDVSGKPTGATLPSGFPDHITITGILQSSGAWVTVIIRQGHPSTPGRRQFLLEIDGDQGSIRVESDRILASFVRDPENVYLNGERLEWNEEKDGPLFGDVTGFLKKAWLEFEKGKEAGGYYPDIEDALKHRRFTAAIQQSLEEDGRWIDL